MRPVPLKWDQVAKTFSCNPEPEKKFHERSRQLIPIALARISGTPIFGGP